jgi:hypothetical protein
MKSFKTYFLVILCVYLLPIISAAQVEEVMKVEATIKNLFKGMYEGDSSLVHSAFSDDVRMFTTMITPENKEVLRSGSLEGFLKAVGTPHEKVWNEVISNLRIDIDQGLAHAWMNYSFYRGDTFSHCGVNAMQLVRIEGQWKIIHLIDTRKSADCED